MFTMAAPVRTRIIPPGGPALTVTVLNGQILHILSFVAENPNASAQVQLTIGNRTATVAHSIVYGYLGNVLDLAGPATVTFGYSSTTNSTVSYSVEPNT